MYQDFGIGAIEVVVFLTLGAIAWGLYALAQITKTPPLS
jgi:hypothetical protein